jgi:acyl-CoA dehydrogenase
MRNFTQDQIMFRDAYRRFLAAEIAPHMEAWREAGIVDRSAFRKAGDQGFLMIWPDEKYGGLGDNDFRYEQIMIEETASRRGASSSTTRCTAGLSAPISSGSAPRSSANAFCPNASPGRPSLAWR